MWLGSIIIIISAPYVIGATHVVQADDSYLHVQGIAKILRCTHINLLMQWLDTSLHHKSVPNR